ncbi:hypothetical protein [Novipirellula artificiosorum]|uniref:Uncharacterized protein n=1 Tax=Novipirellula artificiosorum TaxID=2528016 RepID=A0A5C6E165_9BACT|nr:hypothetical protein [Novipirellula artificiosorum]TWU42632.1 hypothetical protein Poly41_09310 [Novipirellula artificiosorum]
MLAEKFKSHDHPQAVLAAAAKYTDEISVQDGQEFGPFSGQGKQESSFDQSYFDEIHRSTGEPIMIVDHAISWPVSEYPKTLCYQCQTQTAAARMYDQYLTVGT